jgi:hypothetical protein
MNYFLLLIQLLFMNSLSYLAKLLVFILLSHYVDEI